MTRKPKNATKKTKFLGMPRNATKKSKPLGKPRNTTKKTKIPAMRATGALAAVVTPEPRGELGGEAAIRARLEHSGLTDGGKSRFLVATDRLLGGLAGIGGGYIEGIGTRNGINSDLGIAQPRAPVATTIALLRDLDETGRVTAQRVMVEEIRKQGNREAVWLVASNAINDLPPADQAEPVDTPTELEDDWINLFASYAEKASGEQVRVLWGRILAGEIRKPGSFAPSTLRVISEMDAEIAAAFQEAANLRMAGGI